MDGRQNDRAAGMDRHIDLIADFEAGEIHQGSIKDDALGISYLRNGLGHGVILCFTPLGMSTVRRFEDEAASRS